jgi:hypothetical protein
MSGADMALPRGASPVLKQADRTRYRETQAVVSSPAETQPQPQVKASASAGSRYERER